MRQWKYFYNNLISEQENWILWLPVIFACGISLFFFQKRTFLTLDIVLITTALAAHYQLRFSNKSLITTFILIFLSGFFYAKIYDHIFFQSNKINNQIYVELIAKVEGIKKYENGKLKLILSDSKIFKFKSNTKSKKNSHYKQFKGFKPSKPNKNHLKYYLNINNYTEIDRNLKNYSKSYQSEIFKDNKLVKPLKRIQISVRKYSKKIDIGDIIKTNAILNPISNNLISSYNYFDSKDKIWYNHKFGNFNFDQYLYFNNIGATGFNIGEVKIIEKSPNLGNKINQWRYNKANKIRNRFNNDDNSAILIALLLGIRDFITPDLMENIRKSGLAHLISISGLHLSLAGMMFFTLFRLLLCRSEFLCLRFNLKKLSAFLAILSSFSYLIISGSPTPAVRAFLMILVLFLSILFDKRPHAMRSLFLAALIILLINPSTLFSISFQMSFIAILALIGSYQYFEKLIDNGLDKNFIQKINFYFLSVLFSSLIAQIALTPIVIYYFNNISLIAMLSNLVAVPLTSIIIMPTAFIYLILSFFNLENLIYSILNLSLNYIYVTITYFANFKYSNISIPIISASSLILMILGLLWLFLWDRKWKFLAIFPIIIGIILAYNNKLPNLIVDGKRQFVAIYNSEEGLRFSKKIKKSAKIDKILNNFAQKEFKIIENMECDYSRCLLKFNQKTIFLVKNRAKTAEICQKLQENYDILINLSKYKLPNCIKPNIVVINNKDLVENGSHYIYFN